MKKRILEGNRPQKARSGRRQRNRRKKEPFAPRAARFIRTALRVLVVVTAIPALGIAGWKAWGFITTTEHLAIRNIDVAGGIMVTSDTVLGLLGATPGENLYAFSREAAEENIRKNPWVESVRVRRRPPDTVRVEITERTPVALVKSGELYVMDVKGELFKRFDPSEDLDLPVITGMTEELAGKMDAGLSGSLLELLGVLSAREGFGAHRVSEINMDPVYGFSLYTLKEGVRLALGHGGFEEKLVAFERVVEARGGSLAGVEAMDLKNRKEVTVRFVTNVVKEGGDA